MVGKWLPLRTDYLVRLMSLAGNKQHVLRTFRTPGEGKRLRTIGNSVQLHVATHSRGNIVEDTLSIFTTRIVIAKHHRIGEPFCNSAHLGSLATITITTTTEHDPQPLPGQCTQSTKRRCQSVRRVRKVDEYPRHQLLEPPSWCIHPGKRISYVAQWYPKSDQCRRDRQRITHVELPNQRRNDGYAFTLDFKFESSRLERELDVACAHLTLLAKAELEDTLPYAGCDTLPVLDGVDDRLQCRKIEQPAFGFGIGFPRAVIIEVITTNTGEHRDNEPHTTDPMLNKRVARYLHGHVRCTFISQHCEHTVDRDRVGCSQTRIGDIAPKAMTERPNLPAPKTETIAGLRKHMYEGGFAIGSCYSDAQHVSRRLVKKAIGEQAHLGSELWHADDGDGMAGGWGNACGVCHAGDGSPPCGIRDEVCSIGLGACQCKKQGAGLNPARIKRKIAYLGVRVGNACKPFHECAQRHGHYGAPAASCVLAGRSRSSGGAFRSRKAAAMMLEKAGAATSPP